MAEPPVPEELWEQILLRLPPKDPASILRASLVCKKWRSIVYGSRFLRLLAELHRAPPMLGFFQNNARRFVSTTAGSALSLAVPERDSWPCFLGYRHGRALLVSVAAKEILVWEPITGYQRRVPVPASVDLGSLRRVAVVCAVDGCDHWTCHGGPFRLVLIFVSSSGGVGSVLSACEYSSETGVWGEPNPACHQTRYQHVTVLDSLLLGKSLYFLCNWTEILEYDLDRQVLVVINLPKLFRDRYYYIRVRRIILLQAEDGGLGMAVIQGSRLNLWSHQRIGDNNAEWVLTRVIHLEDHLPATAFPNATRHTFMSGIVEGTNVIFLSRKDGLFMIEPNSGRTRKVSSKRKSAMFPFLSFYAPGVSVDAGEQGKEETK